MLTKRVENQPNFVKIGQDRGGRAQGVQKTHYEFKMQKQIRIRKKSWKSEHIFSYVSKTSDQPHQRPIYILFHCSLF